MHEARLVRDLVTKIETVANEEHIDHVDSVRIEIGAMSHVTPESLEGHFELLAHHSPAEHAHLDITKATDATAPDAYDIRLVSVTVGAD
jgi:hydrogenase nickel incorporation protein HypA/HybF